MKKLIGSVIGLVIPAFIMVGGMANSALAQKASEMDAVKAANEALYAALSARDIRAMEKVWSHKREVRQIGPRSKAVDVGWDAVKKSFERTFDAFPELKVSAEQTYVRINGSTAWVSCVERAQRKTKSGETQSGTNFGTSIFEKQGGKWLMVYHHASAIPQ